jgi:hypothetical protein
MEGESVPDIRLFRMLFAVVTITFVGIGCASNGAGAPTGLGFSALSSRTLQSTSALASAHAYIADHSLPGHVYIYALPLTASSQPIGAIENLNTPYSLGFHSRQLFVLVYPTAILAYTPTKNGPVSFQVPVSLLPEMLEVDKSGDLFEGQTYVGSSYSAFQINVFKYPIKKNSTAAFTITAAVNHSSAPITRGMNFDRQGNLWVKDDDNATMDKFEPPFSSNSKPALTFPKPSGAPYGSAVFDAHDAMFVTNGGGVDVYHPPFTSKTTKAFTIAVPNAANIMAIDAAGDLYVTSSTGVVSVFAPPFSASSQPEVSLAIPGAPSFSGIVVQQ